MKKILFLLVALVCSMSVNAQIMKVMNGKKVVAIYKASQANNIVIEDIPTLGKTGTTKRNGDIDVNWVQLWAGGPRFADQNVESKMSFTDATKTLDDYIWGANWCTPSSDDMNELLKARYGTSEKVTCECINSGFLFTGKEEGYTNNSLFLPAMNDWGGYYDTYYWSSSLHDTYKYNGLFLTMDTEGENYWKAGNVGNQYFVRPVLSEYAGDEPGSDEPGSDEPVNDVIRPTYVSSTNTNSYNNQPASNLVDNGGVETRWIAHKDHRVNGVWNIVVSTEDETQLKSISLWNHDNQSYPNRRWKSMKVYGSATANGSWTELASFENMNLATNNKGLAGEFEVNTAESYTYYRIDVLDNEGDDYMQMSDMKFFVTYVSIP